jgi:hypothetical protein
MVSGVTRVATCQEPSPESSAFDGEAAALVVGQPEATSFHLPLENSVLLDQVFDDLLLVAVDPTREGHEQHLQWVDIGCRGPIVPCLNPARTEWCSAEYSDPTGMRRWPNSTSSFRTPSFDRHNDIAGAFSGSPAR